MRVLNGLGLKNGRDVNSALNAISFPDRQRSPPDRQRSPPGRQRSPRRSFFASSKQTCNDGVLADTAAELRARDLTHSLQFQLPLARVRLAHFQQ
jgi:hypothetical protein